MSRYPAEHKGATRARILAASERLLKDRGVEGASVDAVMRAAGLTVGGFYGHFESKEALAREALLYGVERSFARLTEGTEGLGPQAFLRALIRRYFAQLDDPSLDDACPLTLLLPDVARGGDTFRAEFATRTAALLAQVENRLPDVPGMSRRDVALAVFSALSGAVGMARAAHTARARARIAGATEALLVRTFGLDAEAAAPPVKSRRGE
jgi:TetR/AcrR family transcriptional repressor of nem operon